MEDEGKILVTRAGLAVGIECQVTGGVRSERLKGVFSWVAVGLDTNDRHDRVWLDLNAEMTAASEALRRRLYNLDADPILETSGESA